LINFYIDIEFGDELFLYSMKNVVDDTQRDFDKFLEGKPSLPVAGLLYDCILRRLYNGKDLQNIKTFDNIPLIGMSTFGELLGININQTLVSLFFFEVKENESFYDEYIDNFIVKYANYQNFFRDRELNQLKSKEIKKSYRKLTRLNKKLEEKIDFIEKSKEQLAQSEKMASLGSMVAGVAHEINTPVGMALTGVTHLNDQVKALKELFLDAKMTESDFLDFIENSIVVSHSVEKNLTQAASLVKSFKQVAVDQSSDEDREFGLYEYVNETLLSIHNETKRTKHKIEVIIDKDIRLFSTPGVFAQIITNFVLNSVIHAYDEGEYGHIKIAAQVKDDALVLEYKDDGKGLTKEEILKIFDPFFTTNRKNGGSGLGMNIVYNLITVKLKGTLHLESKLGNGVHFTLKFPKTILAQVEEIA